MLDARLGDKAEEGRLFKLRGEPLAKCAVKNGITRRVGKVSENNGVLLGQGIGMARIVQPSADGQRNDGQPGGNYDFPAGADGTRVAGGALQIRVALQPLQISADFRGPLVAQIAVLCDRLADDFYELLRQART